MSYNWQQSDWTEFKYDFKQLEEYLYLFSEKMGISKGSLNALPKKHQTQTIIDILVSEAIKTSEIEGEFLSRKDVMSSIQNNLGLGSNNESIRDINARGMANLVTEIRNSYQEPINENIIFDWHKMVFPSRTSIAVGSWRTHNEPMQVVSGRHGKEIIHFEAPPSTRVKKEMKSFIQWFNNTAPNGTEEIKFGPIRSAIAHLYFESIHPFEDGNGRVGRAIAEKALLQSVDHPLLLSLSVAIESDRNTYYQALKIAQRSNNITDWLVYFIKTILKALDHSIELIDFTLQKAKLFNHYNLQLNERQTKVLKRMLDEGPKGFEGGMTAKKYMGITKTSKATATRDIQKLNEMGIFKSIGGGRSTAYNIQFLEPKNFKPSFS